MKRIRIAALCLVAVFAFSAITVASASAETQPSLKLCQKAKKGHGYYKTSKCAGAAGAKGSGNYELAPFSKLKKTKRKFTITGPRGANYGWSLGSKFPGTKESATECATEKGTGEYTEHGATFKVSYEGCENAAVSGECKTEAPVPGGGAPKPGVIVDEELEGTLVNIPGGTGIGFSLKAKNHTTGVLANYTCSPIELSAKGGVILETQGFVTEASTTPAFVAKAGSEGVQQQWTYNTESGLNELEQQMEDYKYDKEASEEKVPVAKTPVQLLTVVSEGKTPVEEVFSQQGSRSETKGALLRAVG